jgi:uncharacterized protein DUF87
MTAARELHVGRGLTWPAELASQAIGVLGMRGAGKSNLGRVYAEELFASKIPFVVFDPIGNWYGIRAGHDGKPGGGIPVPIFGGEHGDLPLDRSSGQRIADLVLERKLSCVLDLSHADFSETDKRRFLIDFGERLFRKKSRESGWLTLIMEEADDYAPQTTRGGGGGSTAETLGMFQRLVKRGRFKGLGALLITQRSAAINKDLLYMVGTLIVFRTTGPRDQDAVGGWVKHNAISEKVLETLSSLEAGEAWVVSPDPEALEMIERVRFRHMATFDTGATPDHGAGGAKPATLADIDVPALSKELQAAVEKAKAEDPRELQRKVADLRAQLAKKEAVLAEVDRRTKDIDDKLQRVKPRVVEKRIPAVDPKVTALVEKAMERLDAWGGRLTQKLEQDLRDIREDLATLGRIVARRVPVENAPQGAAPGFGAPAAGVVATGHAGGGGSAAASRAAGLSRPAPVVPRAPRTGATLPAAQQRILDALAFLETAGVTRPDKTQVSLFADLTPGAGHTVSMFGALRTAGLVDYPTPGSVVLTNAGRAQADFSRAPQGPAEMQQQILAKVTSAQRRLLEVLIPAYPSPLPKEEVSTRAGLVPGAGHTVSQYGRLRSLGLVDYPTPGTVVALPVLFLEGALEGA